jgi:L-seryl-tRNA(Ser) seleniumtransferase
MRQNPLCRALRVDKGTLAALEATLRLYRDPDRVVSAVPTLAMLAAEPAVLERRARAIAAQIADRGAAAEGAVPLDVSVVPTTGAVGGGTYPGVELPSWAVELRPAGGTDALASVLRGGAPPVVGRVVDDAVRLDVRTVFEAQEDDLVDRIVDAAEALRGEPGAAGGPPSLT